MAETQEKFDADDIPSTGLHGLSKTDHPGGGNGPESQAHALENDERGSEDQDPVLGRRHRKMGRDGAPLLLNLGCGFNPFPDAINADAHAICKPDVVWDLNVTPFPWDDNTFDTVTMHHVLEHVEEWWACFCECARILKVGGHLDIRVPDESSKTALTYRDHHHVFSLVSFHGTVGAKMRHNAWAETELESVPLKMTGYLRVPFSPYNWMRHFPWLLTFVADHMRNFIWEQRFLFVKTR